MAMTNTVQPIHYPERNGKPIGETDVHIDVLHLPARSAARLFPRATTGLLGREHAAVLRGGKPRGMCIA
jgi:hypothetical protein